VDAYKEVIEALDDISLDSRTAAGKILRKISPKDLKALGVKIPLTRCPRCKATVPKDNILLCTRCVKNLACCVCVEDARDKFECETFSCGHLHEDVEHMSCIDCLTAQEKKYINLVKRPKNSIDEAIKKKKNTCMTCKFWNLETHMFLCGVVCTCTHPSKVKEELFALDDSCNDWAVRDTSGLTNLSVISSLKEEPEIDILQELSGTNLKEGDTIGDETFKKKWTRARMSDDIDLDIDIDSYGPDSFVIFLSEAIGCGPCSSSCEIPLFFESVEDVLAYLRFYLLPRALNMLINHDDAGALEAEEYLNELKKSDKKKILELIKILDLALGSKKVTETVLRIIQEKYNSFFDSSRFIAQELAIGNVPIVIKTLIARDEDDASDTNKELLEFMEMDDFDGFHDEHEDMVREFFESRIG